MKKTIISLLAAVVLLCSCKGTHEEVVAKYPDGNKCVVNILKGKGEKALLVGEKTYYLNGKLWSERYFDHGNNDGEWKFYHRNGKLYASATFDKLHQMGSGWVFQDTVGKPFYKGSFDTCMLLEIPDNGYPVSIAYVKGDSSFVFQFYDDFKSRSNGIMVNNLKQGLWTFYYPTGIVQSEQMFIDGVENGKHNSYRENGIPYFMGYYINGKRAGSWEFYDEKGDLAGHKDFDK